MSGPPAGKEFSTARKMIGIRLGMGQGGHKNDPQRFARLPGKDEIRPIRTSLILTFPNGRGNFDVSPGSE